MRLLRVAQYRAVATFTHGVQLVRLAFDFDDFTSGFEVGPRGFPITGNTVLLGVGGVDLLQVQVLYVGPGVGKAPSHFGCAAQHHKGQTGQSCADGVQARRFKVRKVPDGGG